MWIHNFLSNRQQCVAVNGATLSEAQVRSGVAQGTVLGPILCLIHISDKNYDITDSTLWYHACIADDTRILLGIKHEEVTQILQNDLQKLYKWANTNNMKCNANKFELLRYGKEQEIKSATTNKSYDDSNIDDKEQVRDLGIMMSNTPTFTLHIRNIVKTASEKLLYVLRVFQSRKLSLMHADTLEISCHSPTRVLLPALKSMESKRHTNCRSYSLFNECLHTKLLKYST